MIQIIFRSNEEFIGGDVEDTEEGEERDELADLPDRVDGSGVTGLLNPRVTTIDIRQVPYLTLEAQIVSFVSNMGTPSFEVNSYL